MWNRCKWTRIQCNLSSFIVILVYGSCHCTISYRKENWKWYCKWKISDGDIFIQNMLDTLEFPLSVLGVRCCYGYHFFDLNNIQHSIHSAFVRWESHWNWFLCCFLWYNDVEYGRWQRSGNFSKKRRPLVYGSLHKEISFARWPWFDNHNESMRRSSIDLNSRDEFRNELVANRRIQVDNRNDCPNDRYQCFVFRAEFLCVSYFFFVFCYCFVILRGSCVLKVLMNSQLKTFIPVLLL